MISNLTNYFDAKNNALNLLSFIYCILILLKIWKTFCIEYHFIDTLKTWHLSELFCIFWKNFYWKIMKDKIKYHLRLDKIFAQWNWPQILCWQCKTKWWSIIEVWSDLTWCNATQVKRCLYYCYVSELFFLMPERQQIFVTFQRWIKTKLYINGKNRWENHQFAFCTSLQ